MKATYITTIKGKKLSVVLSLKDYQSLLDAKEELEDIRLYDSVKAKKETSIPLEDYIAQRKKKSGVKV